MGFRWNWTTEFCTHGSEPRFDTNWFIVSSCLLLFVMAVRLYVTNESIVWSTTKQYNTYSNEEELMLSIVQWAPGPKPL